MYYSTPPNNTNLHLFAKLVASHATVDNGLLQINKPAVLFDILHNPLFVPKNSHTNSSPLQIQQDKLACHKKAMTEIANESVLNFFVDVFSTADLSSANIEQTVLTPFEFSPVNDGDKKGFFLRFQHILIKRNVVYDSDRVAIFKTLNNTGTHDIPFDNESFYKDFSDVRLSVHFPTFLLHHCHYKAHGFSGTAPLYNKDSLSIDDFVRETIHDTSCFIDIDLDKYVKGLRYANNFYSTMNKQELGVNQTLHLANTLHDNDANHSPYNNSHPVLYSIGVYEHKDTGRISFLFYKRNYYVHRQTHELSISPMIVERLTYNPNDGSLTLKRNNRPLHGRSLNRALNECSGFLNFIKNSNLWHHQDIDTVMELCNYTSYLLSRSPLKTLLKSNVSADCLKSLYATGIEPLDKSLSLQRQRILYHLKKGNTHKAIDNCLHNVCFPKTIRRALLNSTILLQKDQLDIIARAIDTIGVDNTYHLLFSYYYNGQLKDYSGNPFNGVEYLKLVELGFSAKKVINYKSKHFSYTNDIIRMYESLSKDDFFSNVELKKPNHIKSVHDYHDYLAKFSQIQQENRIEQYKDPHISEFGTMIDEKNGLVIRPVETTAELISIGSQMSHCVGSYTDLHFQKSYEIVVITPINDKHKYLACISLNLGAKCYQLEQAKLPYNAPVKEQPDLTQLTIDWLTAQEQTIDFKNNRDLY